MSTRTAILLVAVVLVLNVSCTKPQPGPSGEPSSDTTQSSTSQPEQGGKTGDGGLPFRLLINGEPVGADLRANVPDGQIASIQFISSQMSNGEISVVDPQGLTIMLGQWQSDQAQFVYQFAYGESRLKLSIDGVTYDVLVVAGAPQPRSLSGCPGAFMDLNPDAEWVYSNTGGDEYPSRWLNHLTGLATDTAGKVSCTLVMERSGGIEGKIDHTARLDLLCTDNVIYITSAIEQETGTEWITNYERDSIYLPASMSAEPTWERRGTFETKVADQSDIATLVERLTCTGSEKVSVEAGEFEAYRVEFTMELTSGNETLTSKGVSWYVPGIGRVLSVGDTEGKPRMELSSYKNVALR